MESPQSAPVTFSQLCEIEPRLAALEKEVKSLKPTDTNALFLWKGNASTDGIQDKLARLVGYDAANPLLKTEEAYDVGYDHLESVLIGQIQE